MPGLVGLRPAAGAGPAGAWLTGRSSFGGDGRWRRGLAAALTAGVTAREEDRIARRVEFGGGLSTASTCNGGGLSTALT